MRALSFGLNLCKKVKYSLFNIYFIYLFTNSVVILVYVLLEFENWTRIPFYLFVHKLKLDAHWVQVLLSEWVHDRQYSGNQCIEYAYSSLEIIWIQVILEFNKQLISLWISYSWLTIDIWWLFRNKFQMTYKFRKLFILWISLFIFILNMHYLCFPY